jgi:hypothetical protein|tara:strand:- start:1386 stop:1667 length:282 start_codon:yes stop_codon:yes gene_type:complete
VKKSGAPEKGDLVRYKWNVGPPADIDFFGNALVIGESGIAVKLLIFGIWRELENNTQKYRALKTETWEMTVPRVECKIIRTRQGEIVNSVSSA